MSVATPNFDAAVAMLESMRCPFGVSSEQWTGAQQAAAELKAWKEDTDARLAALEAAAKTAATA